MLVWRIQKHKYSNGKDAYSGVARVGSVSWDGNHSSGNRYKAMCSVLSPAKQVLGHFKTEDEAKEMVIKSFKGWVFAAELTSEPDLKNKAQDCIDRSYKFFKDVLPQIASICVQDYQNLNELGRLLNELSTEGDS